MSVNELQISPKSHGGQVPQPPLICCLAHFELHFPADVEGSRSWLVVSEQEVECCGLVELQMDNKSNI